MCLTFFYINPSENKDFPFKYIQAFNRDEAYERPTKPLDSWEEDPNIIAGRDNKEKGTWLGLNTKTGNIAFLTNLPTQFMEAPPALLESPTRGHLVSLFLKSDFFKEDQNAELMKEAIDIYLKEILAKIKDYKGFNLILGNLKIQEFWHLSNEKVRTKISHLKEGFHMMTNIPFPQTVEIVQKPYEAFQELIHRKEFENGEKKSVLIEEVKKLMRSCNKPPFPVTAPLKDENGQIKETTIMWGTKTASLIFLDQENKLKIIEVTYDEKHNIKHLIEKENQL